MWPFGSEEEESGKKTKTVAFGGLLTGPQSAISQVQDMLQNSFWQKGRARRVWRGY